MSTGWIVFDEAGLIYGVGLTEAQARADAARTLAIAGVTVDPDSLKAHAASARLMAAVAIQGGAIGWRFIDAGAVADCT